NPHTLTTMITVEERCQRRGSNPGKKTVLRFHNRDIDPPCPRGCSNLQSDVPTADHHEFPTTDKCRPQGGRFGYIAQHVNMAEVGARYGQPPVPRPRCQYESVIVKKPSTLRNNALARRIHVRHPFPQIQVDSVFG